VISGKVEPSGLLPYQMPKDMETVFTQDEDVPRDMDCYTDADGNTYDFCFGLNWSGVIDDDRTKTYKVAPLTKPETEVKADKA
jgi:beta-glucosidase